VWFEAEKRGHSSAREIDVKIETIKSSAPRSLANYNECFRAGRWVFAAGQIASDYKTGIAPAARPKPGFRNYGSEIKLQTRYILENLRQTFAAAGSSHAQMAPASLYPFNRA
jgi:enamine deaminase RidA (YjgF/YER057c/UK114 family)